MKFLALIVSFRLLTIVTGADESTTLHLLTMLSYSDPQKDAPSQERGSEILPAALIAISEANSLPNFLPGYILKLTEVFTEGCNTELALVEAVKHLTDEREMTVGIIGLFCDEVTKIISQFATRYRGLLQLSGSINPALQDNSRYPNLYRMLPSSAVHIEAVIQLMEKLQWNKIGILYAGIDDTFYISTAQTFAKTQNATNKNINVSFYGEVPSTEIPGFPVLQRLHHSGTKITLLLLPSSIASELICRAYANGMRWPNYGWLLLEKDGQYWSTSHKCNESTMRKVSEGVFLLRNKLQPTDQNSQLISGMKYNEYLQNLQEKCMTHINPYANVLYDSVWAFALALNKSIFVLGDSGGDFQNISRAVRNELPKLSFTGTLGDVHFDSNHEVKITIDILQVRNGTSIPIGYYDPVHKRLELDNASIDQIPSDELEREYQLVSLPLTIVMSAALVICILLTTGMLVLFTCYRNQPEVKASSWFLSFFMFLGSYVILIGTLLHVITSGLVVVGTGRKVTCSVITGLCTVGFDLVLVTLFTKMLRIYRVFTYFGKTSQLWSDRVLIIFILLVAVGKITVFVVWALVDIYHLEDIETYILDTTPPYYKVAQHCYSQHTGVWLTITFAYTGVLFLVLLLLAFKTRKIRRENFKDTKKVNALLVTLVVNACLVIPLWWVLRSVGDPIGSYIIAAIGYGVAGTATQLFLFAPKVIPPFYRHLRSKYCQNIIKTSTNETSDSNEVVIKKQSTAMSLVI